MPNEVAESQRMSREHSAEILVPIYQSLSGGVGEGVCRAVVQHWLASHFDALTTGRAEFLEVFRKEVSDLSGSKASKFNAMQGDYNFHLSSRNLAIFCLNRAVATVASHQQFSLGQITFSFNALFPTNGYYFILMPGHCFGLKKAADHILFIDANTCEWRIPTAQFKHKAFLVDHTATLYAEKIADKLTTIHFG